MSIFREEALEHNSEQSTEILSYPRHLACQYAPLHITYISERLIIRLLW